MKFRPELERPLVLFDGTVERAGAGVTVGEIGVAVRQLGGDRCGKARRRGLQLRGGPGESFFGLFGASQLVEYQAPVDQRLHVPGIQLQCPIQLAQGPLWLA
jgi:hypothetical protein